MERVNLRPANAADDAFLLRLYATTREDVSLFGWDAAAANLGRLDLLDEQPVTDVHIGMRRVQPLMELRVPIRFR